MVNPNSTPAHPARGRRSRCKTPAPGSARLDCTSRRPPLATKRTKRPYPSVRISKQATFMLSRFPASVASPRIHPHTAHSIIIFHHSCHHQTCSASSNEAQCGPFCSLQYRLIGLGSAIPPNDLRSPPPPPIQTAVVGSLRSASVYLHR